MNGFNSAVPASMLMLVMVASMAAGDVQALNAPLTISANAVSECQTALPVFDGQVRKRPLAVQNEGASPAFVTCAFTRNLVASEPIRVRVFSQNIGGVNQNMTCTLVAGITSRPGSQVFTPRTVALPPGGTPALVWEAGDFNNGVFPDDRLSMTCSLPPGIGLNDIYLEISENIGAS